MDPSARPHRDTLATMLAILGGAVWLAAPCAVLFDGLRSMVSAATVAGCMVGAACVPSLRPGQSRTTAIIAGALAALIARGTLVLWDEAGALAARDVIVVVLAGLAAGVGATAGARVRSWWLFLGAAGMVSLAVVTGVFVLVGVAAEMGADADPLIAIAFFGAPVVGGAVAAALFRDVSPGVVALGWIVLGPVTSLAIAIADGSPLLFIGGSLISVAAGAFPASFGALGAWIYRAARPWPLVAPDGAERATLPTARALE